MITLKPVEQKERVKALFDENMIQYSDISGCVLAKFEGETLGYCLYDLNKEQIVIHFITPQDDLSLADGILRSTLHVAAQRSIMDARFDNPEYEKLFTELSFIKDKEKRQLDIDKLFKSCCNCKK